MRQLVSIVMPTLNQQAFIVHALESVLDQNSPSLELIVADGGSTDGTLEILRNRGAADPRLRYSSGSDSGPADALNKALAQVRGTIIGWLNSDDLFTPGAIKRAVDAFEANRDWIMVYGHGQHVDSRGDVVSRYPTLKPPVSTSRFSDGCFICQPTVFFKKSMHVMLGALDQNLKTAFDFDYWLRAFQAFQDRIGFVDAVQAQSRLHDTCITNTMRKAVAVEGVQVVARHLGKAPAHWLTTYIEEVLAQPTEAREIANLREEMLVTIDAVKDCLNDEDWALLKSSIESDTRLAPG